MTRKNIKVSEIVHEKLSLEKRKEETFDDALKRELGLLPSDVRDLTAYYPERMRMAAHAVVDLIEEQADFDSEVIEREGYYALELDHPESRHTVVQIQFHEQLNRGVEAVYRGPRGELTELTSIFIPEEYHDELADETAYPVYVGPLDSDRYEDWDTAIDERELAVQVAPRISGAYERWG